MGYEVRRRPLLTNAGDADDVVEVDLYVTADGVAPSGRGRHPARLFGFRQAPRCVASLLLRLGLCPRCCGAIVSRVPERGASTRVVHPAATAARNTQSSASETATTRLQPQLCVDLPGCRSAVVVAVGGCTEGVHVMCMCEWRGAVSVRVQ